MTSHHSKRLLVVAAVCTLGACGFFPDPEDPYGLGDLDDPNEPLEVTTLYAAEVDAGTVGTCIPVEVSPGVEVCLLSAPQIGDTPQQVSGTAKLALGSLPSSVDMLQSCASFTVHDQGKLGWCVAHAMGL